MRNEDSIPVRVIDSFPLNVFQRLDSTFYLCISWTTRILLRVSALLSRVFWQGPRKSPAAEIGEQVSICVPDAPEYPEHPIRISEYLLLHYATRIS
jgi:hypothetical protein